MFAAARLPAVVAGAAEVAPILRGACAIADPTRSGADQRFILEFRTNPAVLDYVNGAELDRYGRAGVATPDHTIRTKNYPLIVPTPEPGRLDMFEQAVRQAVDRFVGEYHAYFARHNSRQAVAKRELDPMPRVILVPGLGLFGLGRSARDARIAADIVESTVLTVTDAEAVGRFQSVSEADLFDIEYWSLEQAKLGQSPAKPLAGQIAVFTGGAGTIGFATAWRWAAPAPNWLCLTSMRAAAQASARKLGGAALAIRCDVTDREAVRRAFDRVAVISVGSISWFPMPAPLGRAGSVHAPRWSRRWQASDPVPWLSGLVV